MKAGNVEVKKPGESDGPLCISVDILLLSGSLGNSVRLKVLGASRTHERHGHRMETLASWENVAFLQPRNSVSFRHLGKGRGQGEVVENTWCFTYLLHPKEQLKS